MSTVYPFVYSKDYIKCIISFLMFSTAMSSRSNDLILIIVVTTKVVLIVTIKMG